MYRRLLDLCVIVPLFFSLSLVVWFYNFFDRDIYEVEKTAIAAVSPDDPINHNTCDTKKMHFATAEASKSHLDHPELYSSVTCYQLDGQTLYRIDGYTKRTIVIPLLVFLPLLMPVLVILVGSRIDNEALTHYINTSYVFAFGILLAVINIFLALFIY